MKKIRKVLFFRPPLAYDIRVGHEDPHPPLELLYLAAAIQDKYAVSLLDAMSKVSHTEEFKKHFKRLGMSDAEIKNDIQDINPDVVCIGSMWTNQKSMLEHTVNIIKSIDINITIIVGGLLASSLPDIVFENSNIDYLIIGEGEEILPALLEEIGQGKEISLPGVMSRQSTKTKFRPAVLIKDLDSLASPAYQLLDFNYYTAAYEKGFVKAMPFIGVLASRGCTYGCTFCSLPNVTGRSFRHHSLERLIRELQYLKEHHGIKEFHFYDANILNDRNFAIALYKAMIANGINTPWTAEAGLGIWELDDEILELAVRSGMYRIDLPIESGSQKVKKEILKKEFYDKKHIVSVIKKCRQLGVERIYGFIMLGNPGEDVQSIQESLDILNELDLTYKGVKFALPFPNTRFYALCKENGYLPRDFSYDDMWFAKPVIATEKFTISSISAIAHADRALALKRLKIRGFLESFGEIFKNWGILVGIKSIFKAVYLFFHYQRIFAKDKR